MKLGRLDFQHFGDEHLEDLHCASRVISRDLRILGAYGLSNLMKAFVTECALELNRREMEATRRAQDQMTVYDYDESA